MSDQPAVLWTPPANVRETTEVGRYLGWLEDALLDPTALDTFVAIGAEARDASKRVRG